MGKLTRLYQMLGVSSDSFMTFDDMSFEYVALAHELWIEVQLVFHESR